ncbi:MAG TPA: phosphoadenylyl-sulfate reductase [Actinomycetota bacterium]
MEQTEAVLPTFEDAPPEEILRWGFEHYHPQLAVVTAFQAEGMVLIDMAHRIQPDLRVVTIDTGRLPAETYELIDQVRGRYGLIVEVIFPETSHVESMVERHGMNLFHNDPALRELCCHVRKVLPLNKVLAHFDAWIAGLRRGQNNSRATTAKVEIDDLHGGITKINPIADWTSEQVWDYIREHKVPHNALYDKGYTSIGCAPCTRATLPGEPERAGRWWWEDDEDKECGMHAETRSERFEKELRWVTNGR